MDERMEVKQEEGVADCKGHTAHTLLLPAYDRLYVLDKDMKRNPKRFCSTNATVRMLLLTACAVTQHDARAYEKVPERNASEEEEKAIRKTLQ